MNFKLEDMRRWSKACLIIFISLVFFPVGLYLMIKNKWTNKSKYIVSGVALSFVLLAIIGAIFASPTIETASLSETEVTQVEGETHQITGKIYPYNSQLFINDKPVEVNDQGGFVQEVALNQGENEITIRAVDEDKVTIKTYKVHRVTDEELAERQRLVDEQKQKESDEARAQLVAQETEAELQRKAAIESHNFEDYWHEVVSVTDGDTIKARIDGEITRVRIIGIDAPESTNKNECFGDKSAEKAKEFLSGKWIMLKTDNTQDKYDKYDRLLAYVFFDEGTDFSKRLIEEGYAFEYTYDKPYQNQQAYKEMESYAKKEKHGLWAKDTCNGKTTKPAPVSKPVQQTYTAPKPAPAPAADSNCDPNYTPCVPNVSYDLNCPDIGFQVRVTGSDPHGFDRDGDGSGCESY